MDISKKGKRRLTGKSMGRDVCLMFIYSQRGCGYFPFMFF